MRIISGKYRGRKILEPGDGTVRPTKDRIREAVFNMIAEWVPSARVLDLFAGTGAYGLEAISRGAQNAVFVENNVLCAKNILENSDILGCRSQVTVVVSESDEYISGSEPSGNKFALIFADPPFNKGLAKKTLLMVNNYDILNRPGLLVVEHHIDERLPESSSGITLLKQKTYKDILITVFLKK